MWASSPKSMLILPRVTLSDPYEKRSVANLSVAEIVKDIKYVYTLKDEHAFDDFWSKKFYHQYDEA